MAADLRARAVERVKRGRRHRRGRLGPHRPAPPGRALGRALPVPRRAHAVVLGRPAARSSTTASAAGSAATRSSSSRRRRGSSFPEAVELLADRYGVELEREQEDPRAEARAPAAAPAGRAARPHRRLLRRLPLGLRRGRRRRASTWPSAGSARRSCAPSASATRRAPGTRSCCAASGPASRSTSCAGSGWRSADAARRRVRPLPLADHVPDPRPPRAHARASADGRCAPTRAPSTSTPPETDFFHKSQHALRDRPGEGGDRARPGARSSSRATPTCSPCTRPGSRRRSG